MGAKSKKIKKNSIKLFTVVIAVAVILIGFNIYGAVQKANRTKVDVTMSQFKSGITQASVKANEYQFVVVTFSVKNNSLDSLVVDPAIDTYVTDKDGSRYGFAGMKLDDPFKAGAVKKGETRTGQAVYAVPKNIENLKFNFESKNLDIRHELGLSPKT